MMRNILHSRYLLEYLYRTAFPEIDETQSEIEQTGYRREHADILLRAFVPLCEIL